jgi:hypothetical protein
MGIEHTIDTLLNRARKLGFEADEIKEMRVQYSFHLNVAIEGMVREKEGSVDWYERAKAYALGETNKYVAKKIDAWQTQADGARWGYNN